MDGIERLLEDLDRSAGKSEQTADDIHAAYFAGREPEVSTDTYTGDIVEDVSRRLHALMPHDRNGREIKAGDEIESIEDRCSHHTAVGIEVVVTTKAGGVVRQSGSWRVVEPDSWERLEEDVSKTPCMYYDAADENCLADCRRCRIGNDTGARCRESMAADIVRRAKRLAGAPDD